MPSPPKDRRPPMAVAMGWVAHITGYAFELALPVGVGYWLDTRWGTAPWLLIVGILVGVAVSTLHLIQMVALLNREQQSRNRNNKT